MRTPEIGKRLKTIAAICLGVNSRMFQLNAKVGLNSGFRKGQGRPPWTTLGKQAMKLKPAALCFPWVTQALSCPVVCGIDPVRGSPVILHPKP